MITQLEKPWEGDPPYHPDAMKDVCLSEGFINEILDQIQIKKVDVINLIKKT